MGLFGGRRGSSLGQPLLDDEGELLPETPNPKELDSGGGLGMGFGSVGSPGSSGTLQSPTSNYEVRGVATLSCVHVTRWGEHAPTLTHLGGHPRVLSCLFSRWCYCCDHLSHPSPPSPPPQTITERRVFFPCTVVKLTRLIVFLLANPHSKQPMSQPRAHPHTH